MAWFSRIEHPFVRSLSLSTWRLFAGDLNLDEARKTEFASLHDCFIRELKAGARPIEPRPAVIVSPCDGIVGASGRLSGRTAVQAKDSTYTLEELLCDRELADRDRNGVFVTLRLTSTMYHRFHGRPTGTSTRWCMCRAKCGM